MYYTQEQIDRANQSDLVSFLQSQGEQLTRAGNEYRWKRHDSLTVRGNKWYRHSQSKGGGPVDFIMEFFGKSFTEAVELLTGEKGAAPPPDKPCPASLSDFRLPPPNNDNRIARNYLTAARRIDEDVTGFFFARGDIYEDTAHHNAVFVGRDEDGIPRYAHSKGCLLYTSPPSRACKSKIYETEQRTYPLCTGLYAGKHHQNPQHQAVHESCPFQCSVYDWQLLHVPCISRYVRRAHYPVGKKQGHTRLHLQRGRKPVNQPKGGFYDDTENRSFDF